MKWIKQGVQFVLVLLAALWLGGWVRGLMMSPAVGSVPDAPLPVMTQVHNDWFLSGELSPPVGEGNRLVYLFAPWCSVCKLTFPHLKQWQQEGRAVTPVALSYQSAQEVTDFLESFAGTPEQVLMGNRALAQQLDVLAFPTYLIVDDSGTILSSRVGYLPEWMLGLYLDYYQI